MPVAEKRKPRRMNSQMVRRRGLGVVLARVCSLVLLVRADYRFAGYLASTLPANVTIIVLRCGYKPQTTARLTENGRAQQPLVESNLLFDPHRIYPPKVRAVLCKKSAVLLKDKLRVCFIKMCCLRRKTFGCYLDKAGS